MSDKTKTLFFEQLANNIAQQNIAQLQLTAQKSKESDLKKIIVTPVMLKKGYQLSFVFRHNTKDITKNYDVPEALQLIAENFETSFYNIIYKNESEECSLITLPNGKYKAKKTAVSNAKISSMMHNKEKERRIQTANNIYLRELGVCNAQFELRREMSDKYKQINQYIELLAPHLTAFDSEQIVSFADMGSGKGYLTFALYDFVQNTLQREVHGLGIEYRNDMVQLCNKIAVMAGYEHLGFVEGTIDNAPIDNFNVLIALHACDTATDDAIYRGIKADAQLIVCAPCCHKQIRKAMKATNALSNIAKYGILQERQAEIVTDTIRAMLLEAHGYKTKVIQFVDVENTPKNVMIVAEKSNKSIDKETNYNELLALKKLFGIETHYLEKLLLQ
jgi:SAM-dependent methyltransferase